MSATPATVQTVPVADRAARAAERVLRLAGDGRTGLALLAATGLANAAAAVLPDGRELLAGPRLRAAARRARAERPRRGRGPRSRNLA